MQGTGAHDGGVTPSINHPLNCQPTAFQQLQACSLVPIPILKEFQSRLQLGCSDTHKSYVSALALISCVPNMYTTNWGLSLGFTLSSQHRQTTATCLCKGAVLILSPPATLCNPIHANGHLQNALLISPLMQSAPTLNDVLTSRWGVPTCEYQPATPKTSPPPVPLAAVCNPPHSPQSP